MKRISLNYWHQYCHKANGIIQGWTGTKEPPEYFGHSRLMSFSYMASVHCLNYRWTNGLLPSLNSGPVPKKKIDKLKNNSISPGDCRSTGEIPWMPVYQSSSGEIPCMPAYQSIPGAISVDAVQHHNGEQRWANSGPGAPQGPLRHFIWPAEHLQARQL